MASLPNNYISLPPIKVGSDISQPVKISDTEFVITTEHQTLEKFDSIQLKWTKLFDYNYQYLKAIKQKQEFNDCYSFNYCSLSYDKGNNIYYVYARQYLLEIKLDSKSMNLYKNREDVNQLVKVKIMFDSLTRISDQLVTFMCRWSRWSR